MKQPILKEVPLDMNDSAEIAACDHGSQLKDGREESAHVVHGEYRCVGFLNRSNHTGRFPGVHAQWFFADDVLARTQGLERLRHMRLVGRSDVDDIYVRRAN